MYLLTGRTRFALSHLDSKRDKESGQKTYDESNRKYQGKVTSHDFAF